MLAVITGTIRPGGQVGKLVLKDETERLKQYVEALQFTIRSKAFSKIVFCENSGSSMGKFDDLQAEALQNEVEFEMLSFEGNTEKVSLHGKGYGEGEIMDYVFENSRLLQGEPYFVKITGRLKIVNIKDICERINVGKCYFNIPNRTIRDYYDTKLYAMPTIVFREHFRKAYEEVWDDKGIYLEKVYTRILFEQKIKVYNFAKYPRVIGVSGSTGLDYGYTEWKCGIKDLISKAGGYKVIR